MTREELEKKVDESLKDFAEAVQLLTLHPQATGEVNDPTATIMQLINSEVLSVLEDLEKESFDVNSTPLDQYGYPASGRGISYIDSVVPLSAIQTLKKKYLTKDKEDK